MKLSSTTRVCDTRVSEILARIRRIEIRTKRLLGGLQLGAHGTARKGAGFEFDQIREYQDGDDVRFIDWNSSARSNKLLVRQYREDRNRTLMLLVDHSPSTYYGSTEQLKSECIAEIASIFALVAAQSKDAVGLLQYDTTISTYLAPSRSSRRVHTLLQHLFERAMPGIAEKKHAVKKMPFSDTPAAQALAKVVRAKHNNAFVGIISDFIDADELINSLGIVARRCEVFAVRCLDAHERVFPAVGFVPLYDTEKQITSFFDRTVGAHIQQALRNRIEQQNLLFKKNNIAVVDVTPGTDYLHDLINFFQRRMVQ